MKKKKYLDFYFECLQSGNIPRNGLCGTFRSDIFFNLFKPKRWLGDPGQFGYWGYNGIPIWEEDIPSGKIRIYKYKFTSMRQNVVLLMAAMNEEL